MKSSKTDKKVYPERGRRVFVGMSGGVDSSVAAELLKEQNYEVVGVHLRSYNVDGCGEQDAEDARRAAEALRIPFYVWDVEKEYREKVVDYMVKGYEAGITPNPDVMCNKEIKFGIFLEKALAMGAEYVATGHYIRLRQEIPNTKIQNPNKSQLPITNYQLHIARDLNKDQSYFLWTLTQTQLKHCLFPIGDYLKSEVRALARKFGLPNAEKKDSQGICFLGQVTLGDFLKEYVPAKPGLVLTPTGEKVGEHEGAMFYTIGQRHIGTEIRNPKSEIRNDKRKPYYVAEKNVKNNTLIVAEGDDNPILFKKSVHLTNIHFIKPQHSHILKNVRMLVYARLRYRAPLVKATLQLVSPSPDRSRGVTHQLKFDKPIKFVAPGQSAVFYDKQGKMLGGGVIMSAT